MSLFDELRCLSAKNIYKGKALPAFMHREDHIVAIKAYLFELREDVKQFKALNPGLPWLASSAGDNEE